MATKRYTQRSDEQVVERLEKAKVQSLLERATVANGRERVIRPCPHCGFRINSDSIWVRTPCPHYTFKTDFARPVLDVVLMSLILPSSQARVSAHGCSNRVLRPCLVRLDSAESNLRCSVDRGIEPESILLGPRMFTKWSTRRRERLVCTKPHGHNVGATDNLSVVSLVVSCIFFLQRCAETWLRRQAHTELLIEVRQFCKRCGLAFLLLVSSLYLLNIMDS